MAASASEASYQLCYWPIPFRGCFVSYLFAYRNEPLEEISDFDEIRQILDLDPEAQEVPFMGPPMIRELATGRTLSQMPAIVLYVSEHLDLRPEDPYDLAMCMKILMDCNDVLMEICRYNGSMMWEYQDWQHFRSVRLPRWMRIFEESLNRGFVGEDTVSFADIGIYALFGNMTRCLPDLDADLREHAPGIHALCARIGSTPSLASYVAGQEESFGDLYCGGQIEASIRAVLALDQTA